MSDDVAIIGAGPTGLIAAEILSAAGKRVVVYEHMPSVARKFLMAGRGGLNLTHAEPFERFLTRYGEAARHLRPMIEAFTPDSLRAWADGLGAETFVGSSGRVFPKAMKASPLLRAWLRRLSAQGVEIRTNTHASLPSGSQTTLLALGGASWPRLGSDGAWRDDLIARGVEVIPFQPTNVGFNVDWSEHIRARFAGQPLKGIAIHHDGQSVRGEAMITNYGIEGGAIYALSSQLRTAAPTTLEIDLRPALAHQEIAAKLAQSKAGDSLSSTLRKQLGLSPLAISLLHEGGAAPREPQALAAHIKGVSITLTSPRGLDRAISTAGGVAWSAVDENLQLRAMPNVYAAGEMLDWEAPTGGYLLQGCFATGVWAANAILRASGT